MSIFLSYRRGDSPGYVSKLEDALERAFGDENVFRDVEDIAAGSKWKAVIQRKLRKADVVVLVIGPRWEEIWDERRSADVDYVRLELDYAHEHDVAVVPVTVGGAQLSSGLDLGDRRWLLENQLYDISDVQGRWDSDTAGLIGLLEREHGLTRTDGNGRLPAPTRKASFSKILVGGVAVAVLGAIVFGALRQNEPVARPGPAEHVAANDTNTDAPGREVDSTEPAPVPILRLPAEEKGGRPDAPPATPAFTYPLPEIEGTWRGRDGTEYRISQFSDGSLTIDSPGYASGRGAFVVNMPNKFRLHLQGVGDGEFAVSTSGERMMGYVVVDGRQKYDTWTRTK